MTPGERDELEGVRFRRGCLFGLLLVAILWISIIGWIRWII